MPAYERVLLDGQTEQRNGQYLLSFARTLPALGDFTLPLRARTGVAARLARLSLSAAPVRILAPDRPGHSTDKKRLPPYGCTVVRVWEADPLAGVKEPLEWFLLTDVAVTDVAQARECARQYATRWIIEEFHKALKTGLGAEKLQLETGARLKAAVALIAWSPCACSPSRNRHRLNRRHLPRRAASTPRNCASWQWPPSDG